MQKRAIIRREPETTYEVMTATPGVTRARYPARHRKHFARSRSGCFTCRQRKKKCNEARPICSGCARNYLTCVWPDIAKDESIDTSSSGSELQSANSAVANGSATDGYAIVWNLSQNSFISQNRAALLTPHSGTLLTHYVRKTNRIIAATEQDTSLMRCILPLAYTDDLVMHTVMALGGAHLCCKESDSVDLRAATESHYACVLRGVRTALYQLGPADVDKVARVLLVLILTANYEVHSSTGASGGIFPHLRGARQLLIWLRDRGYQPSAAHDRFVYGYLAESYSYLVLSNCICPYGIMSSRHVPLDDFLSSLESFVPYDGFGVLFSGCHALAELIPSISRFAAARLTEDVVSLESQAFYDRTIFTIDSWEQSPASPPSTDARWVAQRTGLGRVYKHATAIFLEAAHVGLDLPPSEEIQHTINGHIAAMARAVFKEDLLSSSFATVLLWPMIMCGSVMVDADRREVLSWRLRSSGAATTTSIHLADLLETLWRNGDGDPRCWGPYGLFLTMEKYGINLCVA